MYFHLPQERTPRAEKHRLFLQGFIKAVKKGLLKMHVSRFESIKRSSQAAAVSIVCAVMSGCASDPAPNYFNGRYYMAGDPNCAHMSVLSSSRITCYSKDGQATGYRDAMTPDEVQMYQYNLVQQNLQMQQMNQSLQQQNLQIYQQSQQYTPPAVAPIAPPGGNQVRCISTDIYTNCRY
jgi:hypothetical protein